MRITLYKRYNNYISLDFSPEDLDFVREQCYNNNIKWYVISYTDKDIEQYERFSKRNY
jgi:hypothetical protein|tara:strand:- start:370 stop:543 length:174 start_codon:yes stop_codon:yes gene_type:complete